MKRRAIVRCTIIATFGLILAGYVFGIRVLAFPGQSMLPAVQPDDKLLSLVRRGMFRRSGLIWSSSICRWSLSRTIR